MSLVALDGTPLLAVGVPYQKNNEALLSVTNNVQDAANEATHMIGYIITDDGASHTIDTTGSSSFGWKSGAVTFANAGTTFKVGLATVDAGNGPPGRATNVADVVTMGVSKSMTGGGGGVTASAWQTHVPDAGTLTVANGDLLAFVTQMTARGGADVVNTQYSSLNQSTHFPAVTTFVGAAYAAGVAVPNAIITFSDGHIGWFYASNVFTTIATAQTFNNTGTNEYGNFVSMPFPTKVYGIIAAVAPTGDFNLNLYTTPLGTPSAAKTISVDANTVQSTSARYGEYLFPSPYSAAASEQMAAILTPTSATNVSISYKSYNAAAHQVTETGGTNCYAVNRASGAFAAQNSSKDRFAIGLLIGAFDTGGGGGLAAKLIGGYVG